MGAKKKLCSSRNNFVGACLAARVAAHPSARLEEGPIRRGTRVAALGAKCAMIAGFVGVPVFKWLVPALLDRAELQEWSGYLASLDVLLPSFALGFLVGLIVLRQEAAGVDIYPVPNSGGN